MQQLIELGTLRDLQSVANDMMERIARRGLGAEDRLTRICGNILVDHPVKRALVLPGGTRVAGDLVLDEETFAAANIGTIAVMGDLTVGGRILNDDADSGLFLLVDGDVTAKGVAKGGSGIMILGSLRCSGIVFCDSGYGALGTGADIEAEAVIANDQEVYAGGSVAGVVVSDELGNMREKLVPEVFEEPDDPQDEWPDGDLVRERLSAGLPVLK